MTTLEAHSPPTLRDALLSRENSLNFIRLMLAVAVIISHAPYLVLGVETTSAIPVLNLSHLLGDYAVNMFFCISGFLIAHSAQSGTFGGYLKRRILRIFPAYWASILFVVCIGAPLANYTAHSGSPWTAQGALEYVGHNFDLFFLQYSLFDGPSHLPYENSWNGSAWTLSYEFLGYLVLIPIFYLPALKRNPHRVVPTVYLLSLLPFFIFTAAGATNNTFWEVARLYPMFFAGTLLYVWGNKIRLHPQAALACFLVPFALQFVAPSVVLQLIQPAYAYGILALGALIRVPLCRRNDISYGMYIYAWPVQVILLMLGSEPLGWVLNALLTIVVTVPIAWFSWRYIEKPAMALKHWQLMPAKPVDRQTEAGGTEAHPVLVQVSTPQKR